MNLLFNIKKIILDMLDKLNFQRILYFLNLSKILVFLIYITQKNKYIVIYPYPVYNIDEVKILWNAAKKQLEIKKKRKI